MKLKSSLILLSLTVIAASCSKNQYAQVEPDDLYFTHKDRKEALGQNSVVPSSPVIASVEPTETPTEYQRSEYSNTHSPVFATPSYGSPTIQQYDQKPYYDSSVNPDYLYEDTQADIGTGSVEYYNEDYAYEQAPPAYETPQINNYYYGMPNGSYLSSSVWVGSSYYNAYNPYTPVSYYGYDPYGFNNPYYGYNSNRYNRYYNSWGNPYCVGYASNVYWGSGYNNYSGGNNNTYGGEYIDGTKVVTKPRQSRSQASYEVDKSNLPIKTRRADYVPSSSEESGRVANRSNSGRNQFDVNSNNYSRRRNSTTYYTSNTSDQSGRSAQRSNSSTIQGKSRNTQDVQKRNRTVVVPTRTRTSYAASNNGSKERNSRSYSANRSTVNRSGSTNRSSGTTRYSTRTTNRNSYGNVRNSSSRSSSYGTRSSSNRSSGNRTSYSSGRSSSRSYSAPSRSSGSSGRSYSPSRSSSSRSSGASRSSGSSSSSRSSSRKN